MGTGLGTHNLKPEWVYHWVCKTQRVVLCFAVVIKLLYSTVLPAIPTSNKILTASTGMKSTNITTMAGQAVCLNVQLVVVMVWW